MWWKRKLDLHGFAYFRGELSPTLASMTGLAPAGVEVTPEEARPHEIWAARLRHAVWGVARLGAPRETVPIPTEGIATTPFLTDADRAAIRSCSGRTLYLDVPAAEGHVLRDRKRLLRFLAAVLDDDGLAGVDFASQQFWTLPRLEEELSHDAPLDITQTHVLHNVQDDGVGVWLHSHGLAELGFVDFDVLRPAPALLENQFDVLRSIAMCIAEGATSGAIEPAMGADPVLLVDVRDFMRSASEADRLLRNGEDHDERRVVCCDPSGPGLLARLFGRGTLRPSRLLERGLTEGRHLIRFSSEATELSAERARGSLSLVERFAEEFRDLGATPLVKLGYPIDGATSPTDREHLWFEVHALGAGQVDATLVNEPHRVARMHAGQRDRHDTALLSDWCIDSPIGQITPRSTHLARRLRELPPELHEAMREAVRAERASGEAGR